MRVSVSYLVIRKFLVSGVVIRVLVGFQDLGISYYSYIAFLLYCLGGS